MGLEDKLSGQFSSMPPFAKALSDGIKDELAPVFARMAALEQAVVQLGGQVQTATNTANDAAKAADEAKKASQPTPTPSSATGGSTTGGSTTGGSTTGGSGPSTTPPATPAPTPSPSSKPSLFVLALPNPIFIGDILSGNTRPPAAIGISPREGAFYVGSLMDLSLSNIDSTVEFVNWTNAAGSVLGTSPTLTVTVNEANASITANFRDKPTTTGGTGTTSTTGGSTTSGGGSGGGDGGGSSTTNNFPNLTLTNLLYEELVTKRTTKEDSSSFRRHENSFGYRCHVKRNHRKYLWLLQLGTNRRSNQPS
jgi:hypothetical protein